MITNWSLVLLFIYDWRIISIFTLKPGTWMISLTSRIIRYLISLSLSLLDFWTLNGWYVIHINREELILRVFRWSIGKKWIECRILFYFSLKSLIINTLKLNFRWFAFLKLSLFGCVLLRKLKFKHLIFARIRTEIKVDSK